MKLDIKKVPRLKVDPIFKGLSDKLKDPKCFLRIEKKLLKTVISGHKHKTASLYVKCVECQAKYQARKILLGEIGFKSVGQYYQWKRIMRIISRKKDFVL